MLEPKATTCILLRFISAIASSFHEPSNPKPPYFVLSTNEYLSLLTSLFPGRTSYSNPELYPLPPTLTKCLTYKLVRSLKDTNSVVYLIQFVFMSLFSCPESKYCITLCIVISTLFLKTLNYISSDKVRDRLSHTYNKNRKSITTYILSLLRKKFSC